MPQDLEIQTLRDILRRFHAWMSQTDGKMLKTVPKSPSKRGQGSQFSGEAVSCRIRGPPPGTRGRAGGQIDRKSGQLTPGAAFGGGSDTRVLPAHMLTSCGPRYMVFMPPVGLGICGSKAARTSFSIAPPFSGTVMGMRPLSDPVLPFVFASIR